MRSLSDWKHQFQESVWLLGICEHGFDDLKINRIRWIDNGEYKGKKWFADPFILGYNDERIILLVEEFDYKVHRGRLARLIIDRFSWKVSDCKLILDLKTHLSFPMIWEEDGHIYVCPENYKSGKFDLYEYNNQTETLIFIKSLIKEKLTDAILYHEKTGYYVLSTYEPTPNGRVLTIYNSDLLLGDYRQFQRITFEENVARNAGKIFEYEGKLIRPAQECNHVYGHSISFQMVKWHNNKFSFDEIYRFYSPHSVYDAGAHTYNQYKGVAVVDVKGYRYRKIAKTFRFFGSLLEKMGLKKPFIMK